MNIVQCLCRPVIVIALCLLLIPLYSGAVIETYEFDNDELRERYHRFTDELRCPKCQNQNLSGSNSPIAKDLRRELHRLLQEGNNDQQVVDYMVERYGDFILYRPKFSAVTAVLWAAPVLFLIAGAVTLVIIVARQPKKAGENHTTELTLDVGEQQQLNDILADSQQSDQPTDSRPQPSSNRGEQS